MQHAGRKRPEAAGTGLALTRLADQRQLVADALVAGQLTRVLDEHEMPCGGIYAVYPTNRLLASRVRLFVDHLARDLKRRGLPR
jgi:DNA-binding transcriptional LysR family regulator